MRARVQKWGNSLALRIPKAFAVETGLEQGSFVDVSIVDGTLLVAPVAQRTWTLEELLAGITDENIHGEVDTGPVVGGEMW